MSKVSYQCFMIPKGTVIHVLNPDFPEKDEYVAFEVSEDVAVFPASASEEIEGKFL